MQIIEIDDASFCLGLSWNTIPGPNVKKSITNYIKSEGLPYGLVYESVTDEAQERNIIDQLNSIKPDRIYQIGATEDDEAEKSFSLAAVVAHMVIFSGLVCLTISEDKKWILAVNEGSIALNTDIIVNDNEAREMLAEFAGILGETHTEETPLTIIIDDIDLYESVSTHDEGYIEILDSKKDLFATGLLSGEVDSLLKKCVVKNLDSRGGLKLIAFSLLAFGGYYGYTVYQNNLEAKERLQRQIEAQKKKVVQTGPTDEEILEKALQEELEWIREEYNENSSVDFINSVLDVYHSIPLFYHGWSPTMLRADVSGVSVEWESLYGTTLGFTSYGEEHTESYTFAENGESVATRHKIHIGNLSERIDPVPLFENPKDRVWLMHYLKDTGVSWKLSSSTLTPRPKNITGLSQPELSSVRQFVYRTSALSLEGTRLHEIRPLLSLLNENNRIKINSMSISFQNDRWEIKGVYYEK